jgi:fucose 4-O-acetylase-like acetyltransferase
MNRFLSQKFRFYSFVCICLLPFVHGYNLNSTYLTPFSTVNEPLTFTTYIEYFLANGALRFRIPLLFIISGYIYALQDKKSYSERIKRRFNTLIIPFLIWSAVGIFVTFLWQQNTITAQAIKNAALLPPDEQKPLVTFSVSEILYRWAFQPLSFHLWFIRSLFIYNLFYPLIKWVVLKFPIIWFCLVFVFWHTIFSFFFIEGQGLFFFSFGIWICKTNYPIHKTPDWFSHYLSWLFYIGISVIKSFMAFELEPGLITSIVLYALYDISIASGIIAIWFGADPVVKWFLKKKWFLWTTAFSFVIYALHVPLINYTTQLMFILWHNIPNYRLITYITVPIVILSFCIAFGALLRSAWPKGYKIATGGRGF